MTSKTGAPKFFSGGLSAFGCASLPFACLVILLSFVLDAQICTVRAYREQQD